MHRYEARITWTRNGASFTDQRYSRGHQWTFDGGITVAASSSPASVPLPWSVAAAVDPEEALVAAASSCHMLWFLHLAARAGFTVDAYEDAAWGVMERDERGRMAVTRIVLRPAAEFSGERRPDDAQLAELHHRAHEECFIANSLRSEIVIEPA